MLLVPEVHPGLIAHLNGRVQIREQRRSPPDNGVLCLLGQVGGVVVEDIVITYARPWIPLIDNVPYRLEHRARGQPPVRHTQLRPSLQHHAVDGVAQHQFDEAVLLGVHRCSFAL